jgi:glutaredoxin
MSWTKAIAIVAVALGAWQGIQLATHRSGSLASVGSRFSTGASTEELAQLASTVKPDDVLIYTTTECPYCAETKSWMAQYGFPFTECDATKNARCERELESLGADGVPYLIVRGKHLKEGFDSDAFVAALR